VFILTSSFVSGAFFNMGNGASITVEFGTILSNCGFGGLASTVFLL
jgi:hypothetical protein